MKKLLQWWFQRLILCVVSIIAAIVLFIYAGPKVLMHNFLALDIIEKDAEIESIIEEKRITSGDEAKYEYTLMLVYYTSDMGYHRTFKIVTTTPLTDNCVVPVRYYGKYPETVYAVVDGTYYQACDMNNTTAYFMIATFVGIPVGIYTIYFLKKKKKPKLPKKTKE